MAYGEGMTKLSPCPGALVLPLLAEALHGATPRAVLDAGCGRGERLRDCAAMWPGVALCGIDLDGENAELARKLNGPGAEIVTGDMRALPWSDGTFDAALCECTLSLADDPERCLDELFRVLRPGGVLLLGDLCTPASAPERAKIADEGAVRYLASRSWHEAAVEAAGFQIGQYRDCREEYLTMAAQMIFDGGACCLGPGAFTALRQNAAGYGIWLLEKGTAR